MADPSLVLSEALAQLLHDNGLAVYEPTGALPERGIRLNGVMPTPVDEFTMITPQMPLADGRADMTYRVQFYTRREGSPLAAMQWANELRAVLDQKAYTPQVLGISWAWEFSATTFDRDTQDRSAVAATYMFRGRR